MKNLLIPAVCLLCCLKSAQSCNTDNGEMTLGIERDTTLAGSVSFVNAYYFTAECTYDGKVLDGFIDYMSMIDVHNCTDSSINILCGGTWGDTRINLYVEDIPVFGKAGDVAFEHTTDRNTVRINKSSYEYVSTYVKGYIREIPITKDDPATPDYDCAIDFQCEVDGKPLLLKITSISTWYK